MNKREKSMLYVIMLLLAVLVTKSLFFDEIKVTGDALKFKQFAEKAIDEDEKYNGFLKKKGIASYKVVSIKKIHEEGTSSILYYDEKEKTYTKIEIHGQYEAKIRGYFFHVIPYKEFKIRSNWSGK